jgi:branched-chain amino acid transport system ATP-binding protein
MMAMLEVRNVSKRFGGVLAVNRVSLSVERQEIVGIIGPNGSGKTTLLNLINRILQADSGEIFFNGEAIHRISPHEIANKGIGRTFQVTKIFRGLTVLENLLIPGLASLQNKSRAQALEKALNLLEFTDLLHLKDEPAGNLSGGQQKLLEFARALMLDPMLVLLDEPFAGLHPKIMAQIKDLIGKLREKGKTFVVVSHDIQSIFEISDRLAVLNEGKKIAEGPPEEIRENAEVIRAYLGV